MRPICFFKTNQFKTKHHHVHFFFPFQPPIGSDSTTSTSSIYFIDLLHHWTCYLHVNHDAAISLTYRKYELQLFSYFFNNSKLCAICYRTNKAYSSNGPFLICFK
jgi:hypothetical protein